MSALTETPTYLSQEWHEQRRHYLGATDLAAVAGKHKYRSALDVFLIKTGQKTDTSNSREADAGLALEPLIRKWYADETGAVIAPGQFYRHPKHEFICCNTDGQMERYLVEIKTMNYRTAKEWGEEGTAQVPIAYYVQGILQLAIAGGFERNLIVKCDRGSLEFTDYLIEPDESNADLIIDMGVHFWTEHVLKGIPPPPTEADSDNLIYLFGESTGEILTADSTDDALAARMADVYPQYKRLEKEWKGLVEEMKARIGTAQAIETMSGRMTLQRMPPKVSWQKVAAALKPSPDLIATHTGKPYLQIKHPFVADDEEITSGN